MIFSVVPSLMHSNFPLLSKQHAIATKKMFSNWADIPSIIEAPNGDFYAQWLHRISSKTYAYGIQIERSIDRGKSWNSLGWLHADTSETEHGFENENRSYLIETSTKKCFA